MADFDIAFDETMQFEGGYANDPDDKGGETYRGIARKFHATWPGWAIVDEAKRTFPNDFQDELERDEKLSDLVKSFYCENFWRVIGGERIADQHIANELFDTGVNQGSASAVKYLQESLNLLNRNQKNYADLAVDGKMGEQTWTTLEKFLELEAGRSDALLKLLNLFQGWRYIESARKDSTQRKFMRGCLTRVGLR